MPRITHFEFICRAQNLIPTFETFNVFYYVFFNVRFYFFNSRTGNVLSCRKDPPKSLHDWKHNGRDLPKGPLGAFADEQWYKTLVARPTPMLQLDEAALVAAGMSMLWPPKNPSHTLI
ncbi:hypothetical protein Hanom_Chr11g01014171 [Helianthus anomalus]